MQQSCPTQTISILSKAYTMWTFRPLFDFFVVVKDSTVCDQDLLSFISMPPLTVTFDDRMRKYQNTANEHSPQVSYNARLLLFLPFPFKLITAPGTCLDLILLRLAHSIPDYKSTYENGPYKRYQQAQSERK